MKISKFVFIPLIGLALCGCSAFDDVTDNKEDEKQEEEYKEHERFDPETGDGYYLVKKGTMPYTQKDVDRTQNIQVLNSTGEVKLLVVPVDIKNSSRFYTTEMTNKINKSFFGKSTDTSWESVSSYYEKASYGNVKITGEVAPVFKCNKTVAELTDHRIYGKSVPSDLVKSEFYADPSFAELRKKYDTDSDGFVDAIAFIYNYKVDSPKGYWAWVTHDNTAVSNLEDPSLNSVLWASYDFISTTYAKYGEYGLDSHSFIHETGHLFGLNDYYTTDKNIIDPSGGLEMHSENIGDENLYSKFLLGWAEPYYVKTDKSVTLKLRPSAFEGDGILLNDYWNKTPFDEYLLLEYYTPEGLNKDDAETKYTNDCQMFTVPGVRMYHIDSRLCKTRSGIAETFSTPKTKEDLNKGQYYIGPANNPSDAVLPTYAQNFVRQVQLIDAQDRFYFHYESEAGKYKGKADNDSLFKTGDSYISSNTFFQNDGLFNNGKSFDYKITIGEMTSEYVSVTIEKIL